MNEESLLERDAVAVLPMLRDGRIGVRDYAEAVVNRAEARKDLNAFCSTSAEAFLRAAAAADATRPADRGALHGLPILVKDNLDVAGAPCAAGSPALAGHVPAVDAACVARLRRAGALPFGKTNMHELALGVTSRNAAYGAVRNPYDKGRIAGGSSGGTAAALAARVAPVGLGTDTGGSIRIPAALCGVVGFRPTTGRWPADGVVPISVPSRDTAAPMARSVADCALLDAIVTGDPVALEDARGQKLRLGLAPALWSGALPTLAQSLRAAVEDLQREGVELVEVTPAIDLDDVNATGLTIALAENLPALAAYCAGHGLPFDAKRFSAAIASPDVRAVFDLLTGSDAPTIEAYRAALRRVNEVLRPRWLGAMTEARLDALVMPTTLIPAARIGEDETVAFGGLLWPTFPTYVRNCGPASVFGQPSLSLPAGLIEVDGASLPMGLQLDGFPGGDRRLLAIAARIAPLLPRTPAPR